MAELVLPQGFVTLLDEEDLASVKAAGPWRARRDGWTHYVSRSSLRGSRKQFLHTFLAGYVMTDHINGNGLDNRRSNLRPADASLNQANRIHINGTSGYRGVTWHKQCSRWQAAIKVWGKNRYLGLFSTAEEAALAYDAAAIDAWGDYARPNFPNGDAA